MAWRSTADAREEARLLGEKLEIAEAFLIR
jgi:hypothetical protein